MTLLIRSCSDAGRKCWQTRMANAVPNSPWALSNILLPPCQGTRDILSQCGCDSFSVAVNYILQVAHGLQSAHTHTVFHRAVCHDNLKIHAASTRQLGY